MSEMETLNFAIIVVVNLICVRAAQVIAGYWHRSARLWMWLTLLFGPLALGALLIMRPNVWQDSYEP